MFSAGDIFVLQERPKCGINNKGDFAAYRSDVSAGRHVVKWFT